MKPARSGLLWVAIEILVVANSAYADDLQSKSPVPPAAAQAEALKVVKEIYGDEYARAATINEKQTLSRKLLAKAAETLDDPASKFVLMKLAKETAIQAADGQTAFHVVDAMADAFQINPVDVKASVLAKFALIVKAPDQHAGIADQALKLVDEAVDADGYATADQLAKLALDEARKTRDKDLISRSQARAMEVALAAKAFEKTTAAKALLEKSPDDAEANLILGKYLCYVKHDWEKGVPMLALGSDKALSAVAKQELEGVVTSTQQAKLGDDWWSAADKEEDAEKMHVHERAAYWYRRALPSLTGIAKDKAEKRLAATSAPVATKFPAGSQDLLAKVDLARDSVLGVWRVGKPGLVSEGGAATSCSRIMLPAIIEGEYDLTITFTRPSGMGQVCVMLPIGSSQCMLVLSAFGGKVSGLQKIDGQDANANVTSVNPGGFASGKKHEVLIKVRSIDQSRSIEVVFDKVSKIRWHGNESSLSIGQNFCLPQPNRVGVGRCEDIVVFHAIQLKMVSGKFEWVK